jgi:hypothetical protein
LHDAGSDGVVIAAQQHTLGGRLCAHLCERIEVLVEDKQVHDVLRGGARHLGLEFNNTRPSRTQLCLTNENKHRQCDAHFNPSIIALRSLETPTPDKYILSAAASARFTFTTFSPSARWYAASFIRFDELISFMAVGNNQVLTKALIAYDIANYELTISHTLIGEKIRDQSIQYRKT